MIQIAPEAVNLSSACLTQDDLISILRMVGSDWITVSQQFAIVALLIGLALGYWIGMNWERRKHQDGS